VRTQKILRIIFCILLIIVLANTCKICLKQGLLRFK